jgi:hypothetical protein
MPQTQAKQSARRKRRRADEAVEGGRLVDAWGDLDEFGVQASRGVLRHMTEDEERADFSWEEFRPT